MSTESTIAEVPEPDRASLRHPEVRNYLVAALASLALLFGILFGRGSDLGALVVLLFGAAGLFFRWTAAPVLVVMLGMYFTLFPAGLPQLGYGDPWGLRRGSFRVDDLILASALLVYVACQYRLFGVLVQAFPLEGGTAKALPPVRRPVTALGSGEFAAMFKATAAAVLVGQLAWWLLTHVRVDAGRGFSLVWTDAGVIRSSGSPGLLSAAASRFVLLTAVVFVTAALAQMLFWYWRLRRLTRDEGRMILQDELWTENRRELSRLETWRAWAKNRTRRKARNLPPTAKDGGT